MGRLGFIVIVIFTYLFFDWHARYVFVAAGYTRRYGHGKSFNRAKKHYKSNWSFWQRMLWVPLFKEKYEADFMLFAYFSYIHLFISIAMISVILVLDGSIKPDKTYLAYALGGYLALSLLRFCFSNAKGRRII